MVIPPRLLPVIQSIGQSCPNAAHGSPFHSMPFFLLFSFHSWLHLHGSHSLSRVAPMDDGVGFDEKGNGRGWGRWKGREGGLHVEAH
jgi:hypothetical protein